MDSLSTSFIAIAWHCWS